MTNGAPRRGSVQMAPSARTAAGDRDWSASVEPGASAVRILPAAVLAGAVALAVALIWGGGAPEPGQPGLPDAGRLTGWTLQGATLLYQLAAVVAVGSLVAGVVLAPPRGGSLEGAGLRAVRAAAWSAAVWAVAAAASSVLTVSEIVGMPMTRLVGTPGLWDQVSSLAQPRALMLSAATAAVVAAYSRWVRTPAGGWLLLAAAVLALTPVIFTGHSSQAADHTVAITSLVVHVVAAAVWIGGLVGLVVHLRRSPAELTAAVPVFSALALFCFTLVGGSGVVNAWTRLELSVTAWTTGYGAITLAKTAMFVLLGVLGWAHRQRTIRHLAAGRPRAFLRLAAGEVLVMAATVGLAVALARTPTPAPELPVVAVPTHGPGHDTLAAEIVPFSLLRLVTEWQLDVVALSLVGIAAALYLRGVVVLTGGGGQWPVARIGSFLAGLAVIVLATCGGLAVYAPALFSVHVGRFLAMSLLAPLLIVLGRPLALAELVAPARPGSLRALLGSAKVAATLANPVYGFAAYVAVTYALYATPLLDKSLRAVPAHLVATAAATVVGLVLISALLSPDPSLSRSRRVTVVLALAVYLAGFATILGSRGALYAPEWFGELGWTWAEPLADQRRGAFVILWAVPVFTSLLLLAVQAQRPAGDKRPDNRPAR